MSTASDPTAYSVFGRSGHRFATQVGFSRLGRYARPISGKPEIGENASNARKHRVMRVFLAGASGAVGRRLVPLLLQAGHEVTGTTRSADTGGDVARAGVKPAVLDIFDGKAVTDAVRAARPEVVVHQLTDLPREFDDAKIAASYSRNARIRTEGTRNLIAAAQAASVRRFIVQSIAFAYPPGGEPHPESDPLNLADPARAVTVKGAAEMERLVLES